MVYPRIFGREVLMKWLTPEEMIDLNGYRQYQKQLRALNQMGIDYKRRPDGSLVVMADDLLVTKPKEVRFTING